MPRSRSPSPSTTSKSKHQYNISEHCRQQFSFFFPQSVSKATLNGRRGSNACTFIAFYLPKGYHANIGHLPAPTEISTVWVAAAMSCIIQGNATNDTLTGGGAINLLYMRQSANSDKAWDKFKLKIHLTSH